MSKCDWWAIVATVPYGCKLGWMKYKQPVESIIVKTYVCALGILVDIHRGDKVHTAYVLTTDEDESYLYQESNRRIRVPDKYPPTACGIAEWIAFKLGQSDYLPDGTILDWSSKHGQMMPCLWTRFRA